MRRLVGGGQSNLYSGWTRPHRNNFRSSRGDVHHGGPARGTIQHVNKRSGRTLKAFILGGPVLQTSGSDPSCHFSSRVGVARGVAEDQEALHPDLVVHQQAGDATRPRAWIGGVVAADTPTADDAAAGVHPEERAAQDVAARVVKVNIDALGRRPLEVVAEGRPLVIDGGVEAELRDQQRALLVGPGDANNPGALELRDLANDVADGPGSR
mmetsp:Transcript_90960/g.257609  ORF Transcript_90960/g.257609 Transcript_90960/m.257609 type:complete len:211 (+) Transcript_90960:61-693(+)